MTNEEFIQQLTDLKACEQGLKWVEAQKITSPEGIIRTAEKRGDWILWTLIQFDMMPREDVLSIAYNELVPIMNGFESDVDKNQWTTLFSSLMDKMKKSLQFGIEDKELALLAQDINVQLLFIDDKLIDPLEKLKASTVLHSLVDENSIQKLGTIVELHSAFHNLGMSIIANAALKLKGTNGFVISPKVEEKETKLFIADAMSYFITYLIRLLASLDSWDKENYTEEDYQEHRNTFHKEHVQRLKKELKYHIDLGEE